MDKALHAWIVPCMLGSRNAYLDTLIDASIRLSTLGTPFPRFHPPIHAWNPVFTVRSAYPSSGTPMCTTEFTDPRQNTRKNAMHSPRQGFELIIRGFLGGYAFDWTAAVKKNFLALGPEPMTCSSSEQPHSALDHRGTWWTCTVSRVNQKMTTALYDTVLTWIILSCPKPLWTDKCHKRT